MGIFCQQEDARLANNIGFARITQKLEVALAARALRAGLSLWGDLLDPQYTTVPSKRIEADRFLAMMNTCG